jgi:lambda repressor-like predicted transcriptional regulator
MSTPVSSVSISDLQSKWHSLHDLDRASAVFAIHQGGTTLRELAKALNCSESLLRHLLAALQAPPEDRFLARQYKISINELVRRAKAAGIRRSSTLREARELGRAQAARQGSRKICDWLASENLQGGYGAQIVDDARRLFAQAEQTGKFPKDAAPPDMPTEQIIQRCRPAELMNDSITFIAWYAWWLVLWTFYAFTDSWVRDTALELALNEQSRT